MSSEKIWITRLGQVLYFLGVVKIHKDGSGWSEVYRWYHPVAWILFVVFIPFFACKSGYSILDQFPFGVSEYWRKPENKEKLVWLTPKQVWYRRMD